MEFHANIYIILRTGKDSLPKSTGNMQNILIFIDTGDSKLQLSKSSCLRSLFHARGSKLRFGDDNEAAFRGLSTGRLYHQRGNNWQQDVLYSGGHRRHRYEEWRCSNKSVGRILLRRSDFIQYNSARKSSGDVTYLILFKRR